MDDFVSIEILEPVDDVFQNPDSFALGDAFLPFDEGAEIAAFAVLGDDVHVIIGLVHIMELDEIFVGLELFHDLDFGLNAFDVVGVDE